eukprot:TRINITY_DN2431_c0_g1_i1.p1 TRINITY_DN2431_c0_g1~~TRINITY_DN2431_c0_g1_i1.p1  ORF type:complete len:423 (-),score=137.04 TRINITY_DN2431_c0_g1_i1:14-1255(-)
MPLLVATANPNNLESFDESSIASLLSLDQLSSENLCSNSAIAIADKFIDSKGFPRRCKDLNSLIEKSFKWLAFSSLPNPKYSILHLEEFVKNRFHKHCIAVLNKELREGNIWTPEQCFEFYSIIIKTIKTELDVGFNKIADWPPKEFSSNPSIPKNRSKNHLSSMLREIDSLNFPDCAYFSERLTLTENGFVPSKPTAKCSIHGENLLGINHATSFALKSAGSVVDCIAKWLNTDETETTKQTSSFFSSLFSRLVYWFEENQSTAMIPWNIVFSLVFVEKVREFSSESIAMISESELDYLEQSKNLSSFEDFHVDIPVVHSHSNENSTPSPKRQRIFNILNENERDTNEEDDVDVDVEEEEEEKEEKEMGVEDMEEEVDPSSRLRFVLRMLREEQQSEGDFIKQLQSAIDGKE